MTEPKFTPVPWTAVQHGDGIYTWTIRGNDEMEDRSLAIVGVGTPNLQRDEANMRLISAAPEMYEMLASIRTTLEYMGYLPYLVKDIDLILRKASGESVDSKRGHNYSLRETHEDNVDGISLDDRGYIEMRHGDEKRHLFCLHTMAFCSETCLEFDRSFFDAPSFQLFACFYQDSTYIKRKQEDGEK